MVRTRNRNEIDTPLFCTRRNSIRSSRGTYKVLRIVQRARGAAKDAGRRVMLVLR